MRQPTEDQIGIALLWLENNEGDNGESDACKAVAAWIKHIVSERELRLAARANGVTVARLRRKLESIRERHTPGARC